MGYVCCKIAPRGLGRNVKRKTGKKAYAFVSGTEQFVWQTFWLAKGNLYSSVLNFLKKLLKKSYLMHGEKVTSGCYLQLCFFTISACVIAMAFSLKNYRIAIVLGCSFLICCQLLAVQRCNYKCTANSPACTAFPPFRPLSSHKYE